MPKKLFRFILAGILCTLFLTYKPAQAAEDFDAKYKVEYTVQESGEVQVHFHGTIKNNSSKFYVSEYELKTGAQKIKDISAKDKTGKIKASYDETATNSGIKIEFANSVVGKGSVRDFELYYTSESLLSRTGTVWTLAIPKPTIAEASEYLTTVIVPQSFEEASNYYPIPDRKKKVGDTLQYEFSTKQLQKSGITMSFGDVQMYDVGLTYHLKNDKRSRIESTIALPPDTEHQSVIIESLNPKPVNVEADPDGNYLATYILKPKEQIDVQFKGTIRVHTTKQQNYRALTEKERALYTQKQPYWEIDDPHIASLAAELKTPDKIYQYVVNTLHYNYQRNQLNQPRSGAAVALQNPQNAVCIEFTDLFIAIARAAGIPAREINGYAFTTDTQLRPRSLSNDILHAWPEYYDEMKGWVPVDPTWENTTAGVDYFNTFDLNHLTFVKKGVNSEFPYPAGTYKFSEEQTKDVLVSQTDKPALSKKETEIKIEAKETELAGFEIPTSIRIKNNGNQALYEKSTREAIFNGKREFKEEIVMIPPFGEQVIESPALKTSYFDKGEYMIKFKLGDKETEKKIKILPFYAHPLTWLGILFLVGIPLVSYQLLRQSNKQLHKRLESLNYGRKK